MFTRTILVCLGALVFLQVTTQVSIFSVAKVPDTQWENVQKWLQKTIDGLKESSDKIASAIKKASDAEQAKINEMKNTIESKVKTTVAQLEAEAKKAGVDIKDCLKEVSDGGDNLADTLLKGAEQCVSDEVQQANSIVSSEKDLIAKVEATWTEGKKEWASCQSASNVILCEGKVAADVGLEEAEYGKEEATLVTKAAKFVSSVKQNMESCLASDLATIPAQLASKMGEITQCVEKKIKSN